MNTTILTILIIFGVFFLVSIVVALAMSAKQKTNQVTQAPPSAPWQPEQSTVNRYTPAAPALNHIESDSFDEEFGAAKEIIKAKTGKAVIWGTLLWSIALALFLYRNGAVTVNTGEQWFSPGGIGWYAVTALVAGYGVYWYSWAFKKIVLYEKGLTYRDHLLRLKRVPYTEIESTVVDKRFGWGMGGGGGRHIGVGDYWIMKAIWWKTILQLTFKTRRAVTGQTKSVVFWAFHYKDLEEKGMHLKDNLR